MLTFKENDALITTSFDNLYNQDLELLRLRLEAAKFTGDNNRFYRIITGEIIPKSLRHFTNNQMRKEAISQFENLTGQTTTDDVFDEKKNVGYKLDLWEDNPIIYKYTELQPAITEFFKLWEQSRFCDGDRVTGQYDLSKLFYGMINFKSIYYLFKTQDNERLKTSLYRYFPSFATFYYEIYPFLKVQKTGSYNINKLVIAAMNNHEMGFDTTKHEQLIASIPAAENNTMVLKLIKSKNDNFLK